MFIIHKVVNNLHGFFPKLSGKIFSEISKSFAGWTEQGKVSREQLRSCWEGDLPLHFIQIFLHLAKCLGLKEMGSYPI